MSEESKVILLIVEGKSDEIAFSVLSKYNDIKNCSNPLRPKIMIISTGGDKTTYEYEDVSGKHYPYMKKDCLNLIVTEIQKSLENKLSEDSMHLSDIEKVFLVTDMDGVYINDNSIKQRLAGDPYAKDDHPTYMEDVILANKPSSTRNRNLRKRINIEYLLEQPEIVLKAGNEKEKIPFGIFYMSCNLDHVTCGKRMVRKKRSLAENWAEEIASSPAADKKITDFFRNAVPDNLQTYMETWEYICTPNTLRSLARSSNCLFILNELDNCANNVCGE